MHSEMEAWGRDWTYRVLVYNEVNVQRDDHGQLAFWIERYPDGVVDSDGWLLVCIRVGGAIVAATVVVTVEDWLV